MSEAPTANCGFVYCATGPRYVEECKASIRSLRDTHGDVPIEVFTDHPEAFPGMSRPISNPSFSFSDKLYAFEGTRFERFIYIDTDTTIVGDLRGMFDILDRYDLAATHAPIRFNYRHFEISLGSPLIPQFNAGLVAMRADPAFVQRWRENDDRLIDQLKAFYGEGEYRSFDQVSFRQTILEMWEDKLIWVLPPEYNARPFGSFSGYPQVMHDRAFQKFSKEKQERVLAGISPEGKDSVSPVTFLRGPKAIMRYLLRASKGLLSKGGMLARLR